MNTWLARSLTPVPSPKPAQLPKPSGFLSDVCAGLCRSGQKSLPPKYLYDELGSILFDAITRLPEYASGVPNAGCSRRTPTKIAAITRANLVVELGSGSAEKTRPVLEALRATAAAPDLLSDRDFRKARSTGSRRALGDLESLEIPRHSRRNISSASRMRCAAARATSPRS